MLINLRMVKLFPAFIAEIMQPDRRNFAENNAMSEID
ncbi:hypothetical protein AAKU67_002889 [Oxalobacteraceae bacterium GrIS 2.11]